MKKALLIAVVAIMAIAADVSAQESRFGLKAGLNHARLGGDNELTEARLGYHLGAYANLGISKRFALRPELVYSLQGAQFQAINNIKLNFFYLNIPVLASIQLFDNFHLEVGPQVGFLTRARLRYDTESMDFSDNLKGADFAAAIGFRYELPAGFHLGARYNRGLINIAKDSPTEYTTNQVIQFSAGYSF
jgi:hypothetical protein